MESRIELFPKDKHPYKQIYQNASTVFFEGRGSMPPECLSCPQSFLQDPDKDNQRIPKAYTEPFSMVKRAFVQNY